MDANDPNNGNMSKGLKRLYENVTTYQAGADDTLAEIDQLKGMLTTNPNNLDIKEWLAFKLYSVSNYSEAEQLFRDLIVQNHRAGVQNFYLGNLLAKTGREREAVKCWKATVTLIPNDVKSKKAAARIEKMEAKLASGAVGGDPGPMDP